MPRTLNRLKPLTVERTKTSGRYADGGGLYLVVKPGPRKSWAFIYRRGSKMTELSGRHRLHEPAPRQPGTPSAKMAQKNAYFALF
jgi:hypothetical protein